MYKFQLYIISFAYKHISKLKIQVQFFFLLPFGPGEVSSILKQQHFFCKKVWDLYCIV